MICFGIVEHSSECSSTSALFVQRSICLTSACAFALDHKVNVGGIHIKNIGKKEIMKSQQKKHIDL